MKIRPNLKPPTIMSNPPDLDAPPEFYDPAHTNPPGVQDGPFIRPTKPARPKSYILSNPPPLVETYEAPTPNKEIERKFLLKEGVVFGDRVERSYKIIQGYLSMGPVAYYIDMNRVNFFVPVVLAVLLISLPIVILIRRKNASVDNRTSTQKSLSFLSRLYPGVPFRVVCSDISTSYSFCTAARDYGDPILIRCPDDSGECYLNPSR